MEENLESQYNSLLMETLRGVRFRRTFLGYRNTTRLYLENQQERILNICAQAQERNISIHTKRNMDLSSRLLNLEVREVKRDLSFIRF